MFEAHTHYWTRSEGRIIQAATAICIEPLGSLNNFMVNIMKSHRWKIAFKLGIVLVQNTFLKKCFFFSLLFNNIQNKIFF